ncbi:MAG: Jag N-terminal domain-containing protein [Caldilineaceae bacterium]|uniref:RNA-binding protein KhpB n=1 Tax=Caldilineaceae bacterium SB0675_bin_29 TaxID=2605266 RepID=A0A6B1FW69_9CHLR|nr:Jag N-terminal domain-containing protein [Caldilineaceae bacterium]MYH61852.1 KH domain-containing protein [Caldilineaceae bacterium SB0675_bin_29]
MNEGQSYDYRAKTVEEAVKEGLRQLGVSRDEIEIEVVDEGSRGILGIGASDAHVRLKRRVEHLPPVIQSEEAGEDSEGTQVVAETVQNETADSNSYGAQTEVSDLIAVDPVEASPEDTRPETDAEEREDDAELEDLAFDLLSQMLVHLGIEAEVEISWQENPEDNDRALCLNVVGEDLGVLIGRNGETLASMQYLIRLMVNQELHRWKNIVVDIDGYKQRRAEQLSQLAHRLAEQVVASGRPASLEPMPASERRLVHIALRNHDLVYTSSTGEDTRRKVQILLK